MAKSDSKKTPSVVSTRAHLAAIAVAEETIRQKNLLLADADARLGDLRKKLDEQTQLKLQFGQRLVEANDCLSAGRASGGYVCSRIGKLAIDAKTEQERFVFERLQFLVSEELVRRLYPPVAKAPLNTTNYALQT